MNTVYSFKVFSRVAIPGVAICASCHSRMRLLFYLQKPTFELFFVYIYIKKVFLLFQYKALKYRLININI